MATLKLITVFITLHGVYVSGVKLTKTEFWATKTGGNRRTNFEICHLNGGKLLDLESPKANIFLKKFHLLNPPTFRNKTSVRYYIGLRLFGDNFIWDDGCRLANNDTLSFVTGDLSNYKIDMRPACSQLRHKPGFTGYLGLNFRVDWRVCDQRRRMICEIPTTDECNVTAHDQVTMAGNLYEAALTLYQEDIRLCSAQCDLQTANGNPCWFYGMRNKTCYLWSAESQPFVSPLQKNRDEGFTIYAKDCIDVIIENLPNGPIDDNHDICDPASPNDASTVSTTRATEDQPTTPSDKEETVTAPSVRLTEPSGPKLPGCLCACVKKLNQTAKEKEEFTNEIVGNLTIDVKKSSAYARKYVSAKDDRPSAEKIGGVGAVILVIAFGTPVLLDLSKVVVYFAKLGLNYHRKRKRARISVEPFRLESDKTE